MCKISKFFSVNIKRIFFNISLVLIILFYSEFLVELINKIVPVKFNNSVLIQILFFFLIVILLVLTIDKLFVKKYKPAANEINFLFLLLFFLVYFNFLTSHESWNLVDINLFACAFSYLSVLITTICFILTNVFLSNLTKNSKKYIPKNILLNDNPILNESEDILDYKEIVIKLTNILRNDYHEKSFTIGLVGPWGNGKSSVLQMVKERLKEAKDDDDFITFDFLPYLNHKEDEIINEFFTSFSNELKPYNGKLSNLLIEYSSKLTDLYENKNILGFVEEHVTNFKNSSANELYQLINVMLTDVNKKIIVFVDDLDRLNKNEILQVFKLIRNTADFRNTFFVVAMDKEYVLKSLKKSKKIFHSSFIDKFFQLEIYLPEIKKDKLKSIFIEEVIKSKLNDGSPLFESKFREALDNKYNLFEDYIKNIRDVKRTVNQIIYDFPYTGGEVNLKDFINFTYFKLKFPNFVKIINNGIGNYIELDSDGLYSLIKNKPENQNGNDSRERIFNALSNVRVFNPENYVLFNKDLFENCLIIDSNLDCENKFLLLKTLAFLFGEENDNKDVDSIKYENNIRIALEQNVPKYRLKNNEFQSLLGLDNIDDVSKIIDEFGDEDKLNQLMSRFAYFKASINPVDYKNAILILVYIYENRFDFGIYDANIVNQIGVFAYKLEELEINLKDWSLENIFENKNFNIETRVLLICHLKKGGLGMDNFNITYWGFNDKKELNENILGLYKEYLKHKSNNLNDVNEYSFYHIYNDVKLEIENEVKQLFIDFWKNNELEMLCAQLIEIDSWSSSSFKISNLVVEVFGSYIEYIEFVKNHKQSDTKEIKEFLNLFYLLKISDFKYNSMFSFEDSKLMNDKILEHSKIRIGKDDSRKNIIQLVLETNDKKIIELIYDNQLFKTIYDSRFHEFEGKYYLFIFLNKKIGNDPVLIYTQELYHKIIPFTDWEKLAFVANNIEKGENLIPQKNSEYYIKVVSIQPKDGKYKSYYEIY